MSEASRGTNEALRILIADDHALFRRGLREVLNEAEGIRVVAEASDGEEAVRLARELGTHGLDLVLMELDMPKLGGIAAAQQILAEVPGLRVVILTASTRDRDLYEATRIGASGFLTKSLSPDAIVRTLRDYARTGALPMSRSMAAKALAFLQWEIGAGQQPPTAETALPGHAFARLLTPRELEVIELVAQGARDREVAERLSIAERTVKVHLQSIYRKLGARNRAAAAARYRSATL